MERSVHYSTEYASTPLLITGVQTGEIPEDFLATLTEHEIEYVLMRSESVVEPLCYELMKQLGAYGLMSSAPHMIIDVHTQPPTLYYAIDDIPLALMDDPTTNEYLTREYAHSYQEQLVRAVKRIEHTHGRCHTIHISLIPEFIDGQRVEHEVIEFGEELLAKATRKPAELREYYEKLFIRRFEHHTWIGIHPKFFRSATLEQELTRRLAHIHIPVIVQ